MKKQQVVELLKKKIKTGMASKKDVRTYHMLKKLLANIDNKKMNDTEHMMDKHLTRISGMKGAEKSIKDRIGRSMNSAEHTYNTVDKVFDRINKKTEDNDED